MENIPYVFEMVRIHRGCKEKVSMTYEEYVKYSKMYEELSESEKSKIRSQILL